MLVDQKILFKGGRDATVNVPLPKGAKQISLVADEMGSNNHDHSYWIAPVLHPAKGKTFTLPERTANYLDDIHPLEFAIGKGDLGRHGEQGYDEHRGLFQGKEYEHSISMYGDRQSPSFATYRLHGKLSRFEATVGLWDQARSAESPVTFRVYGDEKLLWQSKPIQASGASEKCDVSIRNVKLLRLEVQSAQGNGNSRAVWLEPVLK